MSSPATPPIRVAEAPAHEVARTVAGERILCTTLGRAQAARALAVEQSEARVACWVLDLHVLRVATAAAETPTENLAISLAADAPPDAVDLAVVPLATRGDAELARDLIQSAWQRLEVGSTLVAAVDNPQDRWVRDVLDAWFAKVRVITHDDAAVYVAFKDSKPRKVKNYHCEFAFRDQGRLLRAVSRPGVFAHRRLDLGARRLLDAVTDSAGARLLDVGCGAGVVGIALAARDPTTRVHAIDSHARAVDCTRQGAELNGLANLTAELALAGESALPRGFDVALLNPPYFGDHAIAQRFLDAALAALAPGGRVVVVTKLAEWYQQNMPVAWNHVRATESKGYWIVSARAPG
jgi:16S rRNA G1207 methylase RsmC